MSEAYKSAIVHLFGCIERKEFPFVESRSKRPIFELSEVISLPGAAELFARDTPKTSMGFLWRLSVPAFWSQVKFHRLHIFEELEDGMIGVIMETGSSKPRCVAYDRTKTVEAFSQTYTDSVKFSAARAKKNAAGFFASEIEGLDLGDGTPFFLEHP